MTSSTRSSLDFVVPNHEEVREIFEKITERYENPIPIGTRCESTIFYRVEDLTDDDLNLCAMAVGARIHSVTSPARPELFLKLPGGYTFFGERLAAIYSEYWAKRDIPFEQLVDQNMVSGMWDKYKGKHAVLITDVITTARSSLELHTKATLKGIRVMCWATLIDRTLGPGPVPVVSSLTGEPVRVLSGVL
jgi:hypothetical protein